MIERPRHDLERLAPLAAAGFVLLGFVLRARGLSEYWLNPDEGIYYSTLTRASAAEFWAEVMANAHPPGFYLLLRALGFFTWDFVWLRVLPLVCGTAAIWIYWLVGRELGGRGRTGAAAGLACAGLLAVNAEAIVLSQVLRPYMLLLPLLGGALLHLLRYADRPNPRSLSAYLAFVCLSLLTHYSAALALVAFSGAIAYWGLSRKMDGRAWRRLAASQAVPAALLAALYFLHLAGALRSDLMGEALDDGGWLTGWLVTSPSEAWADFVNFQVFHVPPDFAFRGALLSAAALAVAVLARRGVVAVLAGTALTVALVASVAGVYPFGQSRHNTWLVAFTLPALGWLIGHVVERGWRTAVATATALGLAAIFGRPVEAAFGATDLQTNSTEERVLRRADLAPLVVRQMDPEIEPRIILMTEQSYNLLMPLYAGERAGAARTPDEELMSFSYGARDVVVASRWDWDGLDDVRRLVRALEDRIPALAMDVEPSFLLVAGGWGSLLFHDVRELERGGALIDRVGVPGVDVAGRPILRMVGFILDRRALLAGS